MSILTKKIMSAVLALNIVAFNSYADYSVVVHPDNSATISKNDIEKLFLGKSKSFPDGNLSIPINQLESSAARMNFNTNILGKSDSQVKAYWSSMIFSGKAVPLKEVENDAEVVELVGKNPSAIGYVDSASVTGNVKVVLTY